MQCHPKLEEFEKILQNGRQARDSAIEEARNILLDIASCKITLEDLKYEIKRFQEKCKFAKTTGTATSTAGAALNVAGAIAMFIPGGQLLGAACLTVGTVYGVGGTAINITTDVVDFIETKDFMKKINSSISKLQENIKHLEKLKDDYNETLEFLKKSFKLNDNEVWNITNQFYAMGKNLKKGVEQMGSIGIFVMVLAMAKPCMADGGTAVLMPIAQNLVGLVQKTSNLYHVAPQFANVFAKSASSNLGQSGAKIGTIIAEEIIEEGVKGATREAVKDGVKIGVQTTGKILQGVFAGINVGIVIWDIASLVKGWNATHPAVEAVDEVISKLAEVEEKIQEQLKLMVETMVDNQTKSDDDSESDSSDSSEEEDDRIRVYDKSTMTMKSILKTFKIDGISSPEVLRGQTAINLLQNIRRLLRTTSTGEFGLSSYFLLVDCLHELICNHQSKFSRIQNTPSEINFYCFNETICFNASVREYLRGILLPIQSIMKIPLEDEDQLCYVKRYLRKLSLPIPPIIEIPLSQLCCIYRFRCIICENSIKEFNYVGQTINFPARYKSHTSGMLKAFMEHEDRLAFWLAGEPDPNPRSRTPPSVLYEHEVHNHKGVPKVSDVFEVDIVQRLPDNDSSSETDKRVRRSWEIYDQWLYKAMASEGGGSRR